MDRISPLNFRVWVSYKVDILQVRTSENSWKLLVVPCPAGKWLDIDHQPQMCRPCTRCSKGNQVCDWLCQNLSKNSQLKESVNNTKFLRWQTENRHLFPQEIIPVKLLISTFRFRSVSNRSVRGRERHVLLKMSLGFRLLAVGVRLQALWLLH